MTHNTRRCDEDCPACQDRAEDKKAADDEPLSKAEENARADAYERRYGWGN